MIQGLDLIGSCLDGGFLRIDGGIIGVRLDESHVIKEELVTTWCAELSLAEKDTDLGSRAVGIIGVDLDNQGHLVRGISLEHNMVDDRLLPTDPGPFVDRTVDDILGNAFRTRFLKRCKEAGIRGGISTTLPCGDGAFPDELARRF